MQKHLKKALLRMFPELSGGLHLDRYARVIGVADAPERGASSERFRPRLAVDLEILTPDLEPDPAFPKYTAVPLPVPIGAGGEAGVFAFPERGALAVIGFAYGRQDHPIIRQIYPMGDSLPQVAPGEMLLQTTPTVYQRADAGGNWTRATDAAITDESVTRSVKALESTTDLARETKRISEHQTVEVDGASTLEVGTQLTMLAGSRADLGTLGELNLTAGANSSHSTGLNAVETVGGCHSSRVMLHRDIAVLGNRTESVAMEQSTAIGMSQSTMVGMSQSTTVGMTRTDNVLLQDSLTVGGERSVTVGAAHSMQVGGASTETVGGNKQITASNITLRALGKFTIIAESGGGGTINLYQELLDCLQDVRQALNVLASHDHPDAGTINQGGAVASLAAGAEGHRQNMMRITE